MQASSELVGLYTNLFVITMTTVGILLASLIALTQLLEPYLVSKASQRLIRPATLYLSAIALCLTAIVTLPPMILLAMKTHNFISFMNLRSDELFENQWYVLFVVILLVISAGLVVGFIYQVSRFLIPENALEFLRASNKTVGLKDYFQKSGATMPIRPIRYVYRQEEGDGLITVEEGDEESDKAAAKEYEISLKKFEADRARLAKMENPLFPIEAYLTRTIQKGNLTIVSNTLKTLEGIISDVAEDEEYGDLTSIVKYYASILKNANEVAAAAGLQSVSVELLESSSRVADMLIKSKKSDALNELLELWMSSALGHINDGRTLFIKAVYIMGETGQSVLRSEELEWDSISNFADNLCRGLGLLGEKLLGDGPPEKKAMMVGDSETKFDTVMNAVLNAGWQMQSVRANIYPLIFFDCIYVIAKHLAPYIKSDDDYDNSLGNSLFSLMYDVFTFGEAAVQVANVDGASLALLRLKEHFKIASDNGLWKQEQYVLEAIFRLGALAAGKKLVGVADFIGYGEDTLADASIDILANLRGGHSLDDEAHEILIKTSTNENWKEVNKYLKKAGDRLGTSFGMTLKDDDDED